MLHRIINYIFRKLIDAIDIYVGPNVSYKRIAFLPDELVKYTQYLNSYSSPRSPCPPPPPHPPPIQGFRPMAYSDFSHTHSWS
jgi:hypothetical protein